MEDRYELLKKQAERKDRMLDLLQHCTKISQGLDKLSPNSGDRAIWELIQNACDLSKQSHISMTLTEQEFVFAHQGEPFTYETLTSLIKQVSSSEKQFRENQAEGEVKVGQYGTGFLTTHAFSRKILLKGCMEASLDEETEKCYVTLEDEEGRDFVIDREFEDIKEFVEKMNDQIEAAQKLLRKEGTANPALWTELHYSLKEESLQKAKKALKQANRLMSIVMAVNPKICEVRIESKLVDDPYEMTYRRKDEETENVSDYLIQKLTVGKSNGEDTTVYCLSSEDKKNLVVIPPTMIDDYEKTPSLFLYYPLLGTESFGTNFIFHSNDFTAKEERDGIMLPSSNENAKKKIVQNVERMGQMVDMLLDFLQKTTDERFSLAERMELARVYFPCSNNREPELDDYYRGLKKKFVDCFEKLPLLSVGEERFCIASGQVKVFDSSLYENLTDDQIEKFLPVLTEYASMAYTIPEKNPLGWSKVIAEWDTWKREYLLTYKEICDSIKDVGERLFDFLQLMKEAGQVELLNDSAVIPNRKGKLCVGKILRKGKTITDELYRIAEPLLGDKADKLIDPKYDEILDCEEYTRKQLREDMSLWMQDTKKEYLDAGKGFPKETLDALIEFCSHYPSLGGASFRNRAMPYVCQLYGMEYRERLLESVEEKETDLYETPFGYLVECALLTISGKDSEWVVEHEELLLGFLTEYMKMTEERWTEKLKKYRVFPNQNSKLCLLEDLKQNKKIDLDLRLLYEKLFGEDLRDKWLDDDYAGLYEWPEQTAREVAGKIQEKLEDGGYKDEVVLDVIEKLEDGKWEGIFESIRAQKERIRYEFGSKDDHKNINRLLKKKNSTLLAQMADLAEKNDAELILTMTQQAIEDAAHQKFIKDLGDYVERYLLAYLRKEIEPLGIKIEDIQGGQDYVVSKEEYDEYRIEVKSRWSKDKSVEMSRLQFETAVEHQERFALIMANMEDFPKSRVEKDDPLSDEELVERLKVLDNIGNNADLLNRVKEAFKGGEDDVRAEGSYSIRVPQVVFAKRNLGIRGFVEVVKRKFESPR